MNFKKLDLGDIEQKLAIALLALAPFSFAPSVALPIENFSSFRIGLYQLLLAIFTVYVLWRQRSFIFEQLQTNRWLQVAVAGVLLSVAYSLVVTMNVSRTVLLSVSVLLLSSSASAMYALVATQTSQQRQQFLNQAARWIVRVAVVVSVIGIGQFVLSSIDQSLVADGLCAGCSGDVFGFPRINVFAAEPQFFANALLPAVFVALARLRQGVGVRRLGAAVLTTLAFALSFSRGANLALFVGLAVLGWLLIRSGRIKALLQIGGVVAVGYLLAAAAMIGSNYFQFRDENPRIVAETFETLVEHGSAGLIELDIRQNLEGAEQSLRDYSSPKDTSSNANFQPADLVGSFAPPQQIEASGDERLEAALTGLGFLDTPSRVLFGVGLGNLGPYANAQDSSLPNDLTIYIQYALVAVEAGFIGLALFVTYHLRAASVTLRRVSATLSTDNLVGVIIVAFLVQYSFFGTYINATYVWLYLGLGLALQNRRKNNPVMLDLQP